MRRLTGQEGALSPAFLLFVVTAAVGSLFLVQYAHAHVLRTEAHTAAEAAALAAARDLRRQLLVDPPGLGVATPLSSAQMESQARAYANSNGATLTGFTPPPPGGCRVRADVRGDTQVTSGPSSELRQGRPLSRAAAEVRLPPMGPTGFTYSCNGLLDLVNPGRAGDFFGLPAPPAPPFDIDPPDPSDYDDPDDYEAARDAWEALRDAYYESQGDALDQWRDAIRGLALGYLRNNSDVRLVAAD